MALTVAVGVVVVAGGAGLALAAPEVAAAGALARHGVAAAVRGGGALQRALARLAAGVAPPAELRVSRYQDTINLPNHGDY